MTDKIGSRKFRFISNLMIIFLFCFSQGNYHESMAATPPSDPLMFESMPKPVEDIEVNLVDKIDKSSRMTFPKLDSSLQQLVSSPDASAQKLLLKNSDLRFSEGRVQAQVRVAEEDLEQVIQSIEKSGGEVTKMNETEALVQAWLPIGSLKLLAIHPGVQMIRTPARLQLANLDIGAYTTEALSAMNASAWQGAGYTGSGVKVGVIDGGFIGYLGLRGTDLPSSVVAMNFVDFEDASEIASTTEHGTACAEVIYDIAPDANLYLAKIQTDLDLAEAVTWMRDVVQVDIISTSFGFYNSVPGDGTGYFENMVKSARDEGILWVTAAGNDQQVHWGGTFSDTDADGTHQFSPGDVSYEYYDLVELNYFGPNQFEAYSVPAGYPIQIYLRWDDWEYFDQDYDLYLFRYSTTYGFEIVDWSVNIQDGTPGQSPTEEIFYITEISAAYGYFIQKYDSDRSVNMEVFSPWMQGLNYRLVERSLFNLADSYSVMTVGALDVVSPYLLEDYSSQGPTNGPGGIATGGYLKPNISGYANVSTVSYGEVSKFNGTSAATPHVSGAAALVKSAYPAYTPSQTQSFLQSRALDMGPDVGMDNIYGYGRLYLGTPPSTEPLDKFVYLPIILTSKPFSYFDDFSDPNSGWLSGESDQFIYGYLNNEYQMYIKVPENGLGITPDLVLPSDYSIEVDARKVSPGVCSYGLFFGIRFVDDSWETYQLLVWPTDQDFYVNKRNLDGTWTVIKDWTESTAINPYTASNHIRIDRIGTSIKIYINGSLIANLTDSSLTGPGRDAGLRVYSYDDIPVDVRFDNFSASIP